VNSNSASSAGYWLQTEIDSTVLHPINSILAPPSHSDSLHSLPKDDKCKKNCSLTATCLNISKSLGERVSVPMEHYRKSHVAHRTIT